jgi:hypothetical protein
MTAAVLLAALPIGAAEGRADTGARGTDASAAAQTSTRATATTGAVRQQVLGLLADLERSPGADGQRLDEARARLDGLDSRSWARLGELLEHHPEWGEIPTILTNHSKLMASRDEFLAEHGVAAMSAGETAGARQDPELFRAELLFLIRQLQGLGPVLSPEQGARLGQAALAVQALTPDALDDLRAAYFQQMMDLAARHPELRKSASPGLTPTVAEAFTCPSFSCGLSISIPDSCDSFLGVEVCLSDIISLSISIDLCKLSGVDDLLTGLCEDVTGFLDDAIADVTGAFDTVVGAVNALPGQLEALAGAIADGVLAALAELLGLLPNDAGELIAMLADAGGFDAADPDWWQSIPGVGSAAAASTAASAAPDRLATVMPLEPTASVAAFDIPFPDFNLLPPCPARGDVLPVIGEFGSPDAELRCRKIDGMLNDVFDLIPGDSKSLPFKIGGAVVYFPVNYLCLCAQQQSEVHNINTSLDFHAHATARMDAVVSDLASGASLATLRSRIIGVTNTVDDTNDTLRAAIDRAEALDGTVAGQNLFLETLTLLLDRIDLEEALLDVDDGDERVLALPASLGGRYGDVESVVWDTMQGALAAGQPIYHALAHFAKAQDYETSSQWSSAYWELQQAYQEAVKTTAVRGAIP